MTATYRHGLFFVAFTAFSAAAQDPLHRRITMQDGLPSNTVYRSMEDREGFFWFSSDAGVARFDGSHMDVFGLKQGLSDEDVFRTSYDSKGRIWFYTANGRPYYVEHGVLHSWRTDTLLAKVHLRSGISAFLEDADGALWFGGLRGELTVIRPDGRVEEYGIHDHDTPNDRLPIDLLRLDDGTVQVFSGAVPVDLNGRVVAMGATGNERDKDPPPWNMKLPHMLVDADGAAVWHTDHWATLITRQELPGAPRIGAVSLVEEGELWVSLRSGGVLWLRRVEDRWVPVRDIMFTDDLITHVMRDKGGNTWICTSYGGIISISARGLGTAFFAGSRGGNEQFLRAYAADGVGVWVGTNQGDVYRLDERLELVDIPPKGPLFSRVESMRSRGSELWVATDRQGFRIDGARHAPRVEPLRAMTAPPEEEAKSFGIKALAISASGRVVGSTYGLMEYDERMKAFRSITEPAIPVVRIYAPHFDASGTLWFEENGLLNSFTKEGVCNYPWVGNEQGYRITDIASIGDTLFLATKGKGLMVVVGGEVLRTITQADGLSSDHIQHLFVDGGEILLSGRKGADRLIGPWTKPGIERLLEGFIGGARPVRDVVADGSWVYVLHPEGLVRIPRQVSKDKVGDVKPYVRAVWVNDSLLTDHSVVGIRGGRDRLVVELGSIHFTAPDQVVLQYRILPDGNWEQAFTGQVDLSATAAGNHILQVRAAVDPGVWSAPVEMMVVVVPPILERWWAKGLLVFGGAALVFALLRFMAYRRYRKRLAVLREREAMVAARQRMAMDLHDDLGAEISSILLLTRMEREQPVPASLERIEQLIGTLTEKVKEVIWSTDPGSDTLEATLGFIQRYTIKIGERHGLRVRTTIPTVLPHVELNAGRRRELYLIAKEAVNNTVKHAGATALTFIVTVDQGVLELDLADDGSGGVASQQDQMGSGLRNMRKRAEVIGASLAINDVRPHGTRIIVRLPLEPANPHG